MELPDQLRYTKEHEWVAVEDGRARVGITYFAQDALGDVVFVQLPDVGASVSAMSSIAEVESTKSVSDIYAPVGGTVVEVNAALESTPCPSPPSTVASLRSSSRRHRDSRRGGSAQAAVPFPG